MKTKTIHVDYISSGTSPCKLGNTVQIADYIIPAEGYCLVVEALESKEVYNQLECTDQQFHTIKAGNIILGVLGERQALKGYSGKIPRRIEVGDTLNVLNMGGIIGQCASDHPDLGPALKVRVLGAVVYPINGKYRHVCIQDHAFDGAETLSHSAPIIMVSGTAMNTGKTFACAQIISKLTGMGYKIAAAKLTGASLMRDTRAMQQQGAIATVSFTEAGIVSSTNKNIMPAAKGLINQLNAHNPDVIVIELGDGFIGYYGVEDILEDKEIQQFTVAHVVAATDLVGAWAAQNIFLNKFGVPISVIVGPVTDNAVGKRYIMQTLGIPAYNARQDEEMLGKVLAKKIPLKQANVFSMVSK